MSGQYDRIIKPGESGKIPIKVSTSHATGQIAKSVSVLTNVTGPTSTVTLQIRGEIWQVIQATPNSALFGNVVPSQLKDGNLVRKLTIVSAADTPTKLGEINSTNAKAFKGELKELEPGKKWELTVKLLPEVTTGVQSGMLEIPTGIAELPKLNISCSAFLVQEIDVIPNRLMLPATRSVSLQREFIIRNNASKPVKVSDVTASNPMLKVGLTETQPGMNFRLALTVPPEYKAAKEGDEITFKTDNPGFPLVKIPVSESFNTPMPNPQPAAIKPGTTPPGGPTIRPASLNPRPTTQPAAPRTTPPSFPGPSGGH